ncbi:MAG: hypothetical protein HC893_12375 [Chloroflexaceae bacterium]|nr:hypothetical protein [Chloroflexaceae bacterium]
MVRLDDTEADAFEHLLVLNLHILTVDAAHAHWEQAMSELITTIEQQVALI